MLAIPALLLGLLGIWSTGVLLTAGPQWLVSGGGPPVPPGAAFWDFTGGFLTWWTSLMWLLATFITLTLFRFGVLIDVQR